MRYVIDSVVGEVSSLPGCDQIAVSHSVFLPKDLRGNGLGKSAHKKRLEYLHDTLNYDVVLCTVRHDNEAQKKILLDNNWYFMMRFRSSKTDNDVSLWFHRRP